MGASFLRRLCTVSSFTLPHPCPFHLTRTQHATERTGADLEAATHAGKSLLMACVDGAKPQAAEWLLARWRRRTGKALEAILERRSAVGYTPLWCVRTQWFDPIESTGCRTQRSDPSQTNIRTRWCAMDGRAAVAVVLLARGADDRAVDRNGQSCRSIAVQRRMWPVVGLLDEAERAYALARSRRLVEEGRAAVVADSESVEVGTEAVGPAVAYLVCHALPDDVVRVVDDLLRGSPASGGV